MGVVLHVELFRCDLDRLARYGRHRGGFATLARLLLRNATPTRDGGHVATLTGAWATRFVEQRDSRTSGGFQNALLTLRCWAVVDGAHVTDWPTIRKLFVRRPPPQTCLLAFALPTFAADVVFA